MLQHKATQGKCVSLLPGWTDLLLLWIFMKFVSSVPQKRIRACSVPHFIACKYEPQNGLILICFFFFVLFVFLMKCINKIRLKSVVGVTCRLVLMDLNPPEVAHFYYSFVVTQIWKQGNQRGGNKKTATFPNRQPSAVLVQYPHD